MTTDLITRISPNPAVFNVQRYGILGVAHGGTPVDESTAFLSLLTTVFNAGGGTIEFNNRKYRFDSQWLIPNDGATPPKQPSLRIVGQGALFGGQGSAPNGGTIIDLRFIGTPAKIDTRGLGLLAIGELTLMDGGASDSTPFLQTTNSTIHIIGSLGFYGNTPNTPTQDAIILGGTATGAADGTSNSPFQGYGTVIEKVYFNRIRRGVYGRTYCNAVVIRDNTWWTQCGATSAAAAIEFLADVSNTDTGNWIHGNLIEMPNYVYGMKFGGPFINNNLGPNGFFDPEAGTLAYYRFEASAVYNLVIDGFREDASGTLISETGASVGTNMVLTAHQTQRNKLTQPADFLEQVKSIRNNAATYEIQNTGGDVVSQLITGSEWHFNHTPSGGSQETILKLYRVSSSRKDFSLNGSSDSRLFAISDLRIQAESGSTLWLGTRGTQNVQLLSANGTLFNVGISQNGTGAKHGRVSTGSIAAASSADVTLTFGGTAFADTNYTATATVDESTGLLQVTAIKTKNAGSIVVTVKNLDTVNALTGTLNVVAIHD